MRRAGSSRLVAGSSSGTQGVQRPQTRIFSMNVDEARANPDFVTGIILFLVCLHNPL